MKPDAWAVTALRKLAGSLSGRLMAMVALCGSAVFMVGGVLLHSMLREVLERQVHDELSLRTSVYQSLLGRDVSEAQWREYVVPKLDSLLQAAHHTRVWIESDDPRFRYGVPVPGLAELARTEGFGRLMIADDACEQMTQVSTVAARGDRPAVRLVVARNPEAFWQTLDHFRNTLTATVLIGMVVVALLGHWIARLGLRPLGRLSRQAQGLSPSQPEARLGISPLPAELLDLTRSFNGALDRLERSRRQLESFNADVAHELRTPLMNLIGETQVTLSRPRRVQDLEEVMQSNLEEYERMRGIVNDMLFLARADQGALALDATEVSLADEIGKVVEFVEPFAEDAGVTIRVHGDVQACIEAALFRRAVGNLLLNAIEHSRTGGEVVIAVERKDDGLPCVSVSNPGQSIEPRHLEHLFDRFYRVDGARRNSVESHGLGLAIVKAVATMHCGKVFVRSEDGWNTFGFSLASRI